MLSLEELDASARLVHALKYRDRPDAGSLMARMMARAGRSLLAGVLEHYPLETFHHQVLIAERDADGFYRRMGMSAVGAFGLTAFIRTQGKQRD